MTTNATTSVLILTRDFPPYYGSLGGVIRTLKLAEYLQSAGIQTFVVAAKGVPIDYFGYEGLVATLNVTYVDDHYKRYMNLKQRPASVKHRAPQSSTIRPTGLSSRALLSAEHAVSGAVPPDLGVFFNGGLYAAAASLIERYSIANVIVSSPPHSTQLIGLRLKRRFGSKIKLFIDYRDSWNTTRLFRKTYKLSQLLNKHLEKRVLRNADHLLYVSSPMIEKLRINFSHLPPASTLVMNGYDDQMLTMARATHVRADSNQGMLTLGHFGSFSSSLRSFRDPTLLVQAIANHELPIRIKLYGTYSAPPQDENLRHTIETHEQVPHAQALDTMARMDVLLLLHSQYEDSDEVVSGKLFEYIAARRPILVLGSPDMEAARLVRDHGFGYFADLRDERQLVRVLRLLIDKKAKNDLIPASTESIAPFSRQHQYAKILPALATSA